MYINIFLSQLVVLLLCGIVIIAWARRFKLPETLFLVVLGLFLGKAQIGGNKLFELPADFINVIIVIALILVVFDSAQKIRIKALDNINISIMRFTLFSFFANFILITLLVNQLFDISWSIAALFSIIISSTSPGILFSKMNFKPSKATTLLFLESEINTPLMFLLSFIIIDLYRISTGFGFSILPSLGDFIQLVVIGAGVGLIFGIVLFKLFNHRHSEHYPGIYLFVLSLLAYVVAEALNGEGLFSVFVLGLIFANTTIKKKDELKEFSTVISLFIEIMSFVLIGLVIDLNLSLSFILLSLGVFIVYLAIRYVCVMNLIKDYDDLFFDRIFITLTDLKGMGPAVLVLFLSTTSIPGKSDLLSLITYFIIFSSIIGIYVKFKAKRFIPQEELN